MAKPGSKLGVKNPQVNRYAAVKLRQLIATELRKPSHLGWLRMYKEFAAKGWIPLKADKELLESGGFSRQYRQVKKDLNQPYSLLSIKFLHRAIMAAYNDGKKCKVDNYNGLRELARMTGLQEITLKDILILEGEIE